MAEILGQLGSASARRTPASPRRGRASPATGRRRTAAAHRARAAARTGRCRSRRRGRRDRAHGASARAGQHRRPRVPARDTKARASFASKLAAKLAKVSVTNASDARAGTSRPVHAASMWRAIGWAGSSTSQSSKILIAASTSPIVEWASASSLRASGCFGRRVSALQKQATASWLRCRLISSTPRLVCASMWSGAMRIAAPIGPLGLGRPFGRAQQHAQIAVGVGMFRVELDRARERRDRLVDARLRLVGDAEVAVPVRATGLAGEAALHQREGLVAASSLLGEDARVVQRIGMIGRGREDPAVERLGLGELLIPLQKDGDGDRLVERQIAASRVGLGRQLARARSKAIAGLAPDRRAH